MTNDELLAKDPDQLTDTEITLILELVTKDPAFFFNYIRKHGTYPDGTPIHSCSEDPQAHIGARS